MKKIILFFLLAACSKQEVKPVEKTSTTVSSVGVDTTVIMIDKKSKKGHERPK